MRSEYLRLLLLVSVLALSGNRAAAEPEQPIITKGKGEQCVEPVDVMRRMHMYFLKHERDETVHSGIRGRSYSLVGCVDCHTQKDAKDEFIPVNAEDQFCASCHAYSAVKIDCFECHATKPEQ